MLSDVLEPVVYSPAYVEAHREERVLRRKQIAALPTTWFEGLIGLLDSAESFSLRAELAAIRCPTLVVAAELDGFIPLERCRGLAEAIPGADFKIIKGAGHAVVVEQPETVVNLAVGVLRSDPEVEIHAGHEDTTGIPRSIANGKSNRQLRKGPANAHAMGQ